MKKIITLAATVLKWRPFKNDPLRAIYNSIKCILVAFMDFGTFSYVCLCCMYAVTIPGIKFPQLDLAKKLHMCNQKQVPDHVFAKWLHQFVDPFSRHAAKWKWGPGPGPHSPLGSSFDTFLTYVSPHLTLSVHSCIHILTCDMYASM